jgi:hypothetical protein
LAVVAPVWLAAQQVEKLTYTLRHRDVRSVAARVAEELGPQGQVWVDGAKNQVTVQDSPSRLVQIRRLVSELDAPARRFAIATQLEVLPRAEPPSLFAPSPQFADMTAWAESAKPSATYSCVLDLKEGGRAACAMGLSYRIEVAAQGYDPTRRRLALASLTLSALQRGKPDEAVLQGAAVLPVGVATLLLVNPTKLRPPLRLRAVPQVVPEVQQPEAR